MLKNIKLTAFQAHQGDCLLLRSCSSDGIIKNFLIDAGLASSYHRTLKMGIKEIIQKGEKIDLAIVSHYDNDHIQGYIPLLREYGIDYIDQFWFNYSSASFAFPDPKGAIGVKEGIEVRDYLLKNSKLPADDIYFPQCLTIGNALFTILSPTKADLKKIKSKWKEVEETRSDYSIPIGSGTNDKQMSVDDLVKLEFVPDRSLSNNSSIAFILSIDGKSLLFTADSNPTTLEDSIRQVGFSIEVPLRLDLMQVSHHASRFNTSNSLLKLIDCRNFLISTNPSNRYDFPHKTTLARIVKAAHIKNSDEPIVFYFNYDHSSLRSIFTKEEVERYNIEYKFPSSEQNGISIEI